MTKIFQKLTTSELRETRLFSRKLHNLAEKEMENRILAHDSWRLNYLLEKAESPFLVEKQFNLAKEKNGKHRETIYEGIVDFEMSEVGCSLLNRFLRFYFAQKN